MKEEDDASEDPVDDGEHEVEADVLLELGQGAQDEGDGAQSEAEDQRTLHVLGRLLLDQVLV